MGRKRTKGRPADPIEIARRRAAEREFARSPDRWGLDPAALRLEANADVETRANAAGRLDRARRCDVFDLFLVRGRLSHAAHDAVRRLQADIAALHRSASGGGDYSPRVDTSRDPQGLADGRLRAGRRIERVLGLAGPASARLISGLCEPEIVLGRSADWRVVVARETGERLADAQGAALRAACDNLAGAYSIIDRADRPTKAPS